MDILLIIIGLIFMLIGVLGSLIPVLPGVSISWLGLLLLYFTKSIPFNYWILGTTLFLTILFSVLDYLIPAKATKKFGGSSYGIWGTNIGLIIGILAPIPFGFIIGPFLGALIGELLLDSKNHNRALKAATGSFIGFLTSSFIQFLVSVLFLALFITLVWQHKEGLF
ncbi:DUF456 domain-containing protein [Flavobacterium sp. K5-23]|uniref:DUF456 domain-containing protein n=1 Tax=Flavobacterium sp. K5-23 TaxID=2746225 RepID=UPI00201030A1|nr:DUF456 domain-containing protein [Flavobacterium sp. K5-23]UQD55832.1 DUF456 domain-containing protein [Flavobacterium sp. K5-23]